MKNEPSLLGVTSQSLFQILLLIVEEHLDTESNSIKRISNQGLRALHKHREGEVGMSDTFGYYSLWDRIQVKLQLTGKSRFTFQFFLINRNLRYWHETFKTCEETMRSPKHQTYSKFTMSYYIHFILHLTSKLPSTSKQAWTKLSYSSKRF